MAASLTMPNATAKCEPSLKDAKPEGRYQFERLGYFAIDPDSKLEIGFQPHHHVERHLGERGLEDLKDANIIKGHANMLFKISILFFTTALAALADENLPALKANGESYSNVTVIKVTATDIYFTHARGVGNAKLKDLSPELQRLFHYDAAKGLQTETERAQASAEYYARVRQNRPAPPKTPDDTGQTSSAANGDDFVVPKLYARSFRGQPAPAFVVEKWLTARPDTAGKFVLIDFWATWCGPCRRSIPKINAFHAKYNDRLAVIGVSDETEADVRKMKSPQIDYAVANDTRARMSKVLEITGIPHCILIDPKGIVRYEGMPQYLDDQKLEHFLEKYSK